MFAWKSSSGWVFSACPSQATCQRLHERVAEVLRDVAPEVQRQRPVHREREHDPERDDAEQLAGGDAGGARPASFPVGRAGGVSFYTRPASRRTWHPSVRRAVRSGSARARRSDAGHDPPTRAAGRGARSGCRRCRARRLARRRRAASRFSTGVSQPRADVRAQAGDVGRPRLEVVEDIAGEQRLVAGRRGRIAVQLELTGASLRRLRRRPIGVAARRFRGRRRCATARALSNGQVWCRRTTSVA